MVSVATPAVAQQYQYVARTEAPALRQGAVTAGPLTWQCQGSACSIGGPWPAPGVAACAALAREIGRIRAYGRQGAMLNAQQLTTCNAGIPASAPVLGVPPRVLAPGPVITAQPQPAPSGPTAVTTSELSFIVDPTTTPRPAEVSVAVTTSELSFVASAEATPVAPPGTATIPVTTSELSFVVR
jgi:hypothetical protein